MKKDLKDKFAFTLAEVLITLGIIGVVSAMTIPTLVANYQQKSWGTSDTVFKRKLTEALKVMNTQQTLAGHSTTESFVAELSKHMKTNKICNNNLLNCFNNSITMRQNPITVDLTNISTSADLGQSDWDTNLVGVQFANGVTALIAYNPDCRQDPYSNQVTGSSCLAILYDTSGRKSPNYLSKDLRANEYVKKIGDRSVCAFELGNTCFATTTFDIDPYTWKGCNRNGVTTNAEDLAFMSDHGIETCMTTYIGTKDYWAGAVKACGHVSKLPTPEQAQLILDHIYTKNSYNILRLNKEKAAALGMYPDKYGEIDFWTNNDYWSSSRIQGHALFEDNSYPSTTGGTDRSNYGTKGLCIGY